MNKMPSDTLAPGKSVKDRNPLKTNFIERALLGSGLSGSKI